MRITGSMYVRIFSLIAYFAPLSLFPSVPVAAQGTPQLADKAEKPQSTPPMATAKQTKKKTNVKKTAPQATAVTEDEALASFETFTIEWMNKLLGTEEFQRTERIKITKASDGFSAEYIGYLPHRYIVVKKTTSKETPFIGILTYYERTLRCVGKTREEAIQGPFQQAGTSQVSEIFRFTKGEWRY